MTDRYYTAPPNEADVRADFSRRLWDSGYYCRHEVLLPSPYHRSGFFRADALILDVHDKMLALVEFKTEGSTPGARSGGDGRQKRAYEASGLPWRYCLGHSQITDTINWLRTL